MNDKELLAVRAALDEMKRHGYALGKNPWFYGADNPEGRNHIQCRCGVRLRHTLDAMNYHIVRCAVEAYKKKEES